MTILEDSIVRDPGLAEIGGQKLDWVAGHSPVLRLMAERYLNDGTFDGLTVGMAIPIGPKVAHLATVLQAAGARVVVCTPDPHFVQDDAAAALASRGVTVYGSTRQQDLDMPDNFRRVLAHQPDVLLDDRAHLTRLAVTLPKAERARLRGASEQTTTGVTRLRAIERESALPFPAIAANDARCKHMFDNRYGTGQSTLSAILDTTNLFLGGKAVVVAGYGWVGRGVALRARGMHAQVIVTEVEPIRALEALADGFRVMGMAEAAALGDVFITCTGASRVITGEHFARMRDNALLANAGAVDTEVDVAQLAALAVRRERPRAGVESFEMADGRQLHLLADGRVVNVSAGEGHPIEIMDLTYAVQAMSLYYLANNYQRLAPHLYAFPDELDDAIARLALEAHGASLDRLPAENGSSHTRDERGA